MGPSLLFDKSFLQSLSVEEAAILDQMFACTICPLFISETLADLAKSPDGGRNPMKIIGELAAKTPVARGYMNAFHSRILLEELLGNQVPMDYRPMVAGGVPVNSDDGLGIVYKRSPEALAFERWQEHKFLEVEHIAAHIWRRSLGELNLPKIRNAFQAMLKKEHRPKNRDEAKKLASGIIDASGQKYQTLLIAHALLDMPPDTLRDVVRIWRSRGSKTIRVHAPFTAYCLQIDLYFYLCLSNGIISDQRASHKVDMGYLYYAPFAHAFVSSDRLHRDHAPIFLNESQQFVWGPHLKADLKVLNEHFHSLPDAEKAQGLFTLASHPPQTHKGLSAQLWDRFRAGWRTAKSSPPTGPLGWERKLLGESKRLIAAADLQDMPPPPRPEAQFGHDQFDRMLIQRAIPRQRGSWRMFSVEIERAEDTAESGE